MTRWGCRSSSARDAGARAPRDAWAWFFWLVAALAVLDVVLTTWGLTTAWRLGWAAEELNPAVAWLSRIGPAGLLAMAGLKVVALALYGYFRRVLRKPDPNHPVAGLLAAGVVDALALTLSGGAVIVGLQQAGVFL